MVNTDKDSLCPLQNPRVRANQVEQPQGRPGRLAPAFLPTDGGHLGRVEQGAEDGLAHVKPATHGSHVLGPERPDALRQR